MSRQEVESPYNSQLYRLILNFTFREKHYGNNSFFFLKLVVQIWVVATVLWLSQDFTYKLIHSSYVQWQYYPIGSMKGEEGDGLV